MKTMQEDICDTALALGLAAGERSGAAAPSGGSFSRRPSLTLSLSDSGADAYGPPKGAEGSRKPSVNVEGGTGRVSSPHSAVSSFSTVAWPSSSAVKRERVIGGGEEAEVERASSRASDDEEEEGGARKKLRLTKEQSALLEDRFKEHSALNPKQKQILAKQLNLRPRQVEVWFQNRRARTKLKQTEVDCQFLKRCCERLADENRRLQKELQELKSLQFNPHPLYLQFPAATLSMCPSCERIGGGGGGSNVSDNKGRAASVAVRPFVASPKPHFFNPFTHSAAC